MGFPSARPVTGPKPSPEELRGLGVETLVLLAGDSRAHDAGKVAAKARRLLPHAGTATVAGATHHSVPQGAGADETGRRMEDFLSAPARP